ncbi:MAG: DUF3575 domain-containing protein [Clostridium sp.]|nr:DUF3575 domain-containing protein [Clostridium sp.]
MRYSRILLAFTALLLCKTTLSAQTFGLKTNLIQWATASPNIGIEIGLTERWTLNASGSYNPFEFGNDRKWKHWLVQPEVRFWTCERFNGHFVGVHALGGEFNASRVKMPFGYFTHLKDQRMQGWMAGGGITYGYQWVVSKRFSIEAAIGAGVVHVDYKRYNCNHCGQALEHNHKLYIGPTKLALNLIYFIR